MAALFAIILFLSASLLFWVQPMVAKMVLPFLGGTPAVWNTCMLFFQAMLLAGYAYAHWLGKHLTLRAQVAVHTTLLALAALALPIHLARGALKYLPAEANPSFWLLGCLLVTVGLPFFAIAANGPLLQRWFSYSRNHAARDPYFLYAASNLGSLIALLGYPLLLERRWRLGEQNQGWMAFFLVLVALIFAGGLFLLGTLRAVSAAPAEEVPPVETTPIAITSKQRVRWCLLSFAPSSLMLGLTTYLTTDVASIPLLWVLPLAIYLLTFVLLFAPRHPCRSSWAVRVLQAAAIVLAYTLLSEATEPIGVLILLHLGVFLVAAMACHGQLAAERPAPAHLTEFYLWISIGGVMGGMFNALAAPLLFTRIAEYPAAMVLACWLRPSQKTSASRPRDRYLDLSAPLAVALLVVVLFGLVSLFPSVPLQARLGLVLGVPLLSGYATVDRPRRYALCLGAVLLTGPFLSGIHGRPLYAERNFFGVLRVTRDPIGPFYRLVHGNTIHGRQWIDPARQQEPLSYYHRTGPLGQVFDVCHRRAACTNIGVVGLGAGSMASYARPAEHWTFYEINPAVVRIASNTNYFTFLEHSAARRIDMVLGDARLRLEEAPLAQFDLLVLDAFSSDAIPMHLITREALRLYLSKLAPGGMLVFHISNRCLELEDVLGDLAKDAHLICHAQDEVDPGPLEMADGKDQSHWLVMVRRREDLGRLAKDSRWLPVRGRSEPSVWTDDFSNIISAFKWR